MQTPVTNYWFKNVLRPYLCIEISKQNFHMVPREPIKYLF
jgi:hypothetical protein